MSDPKPTSVYVRLTVTKNMGEGKPFQVHVKKDKHEFDDWDGAYDKARKVFEDQLDGIRDAIQFDKDNEAE